VREINISRVLRPNWMLLRIKARLDIGWMIADRKTMTLKSHWAPYRIAVCVHSLGAEKRSMLDKRSRTKTKKSIYPHEIRPAVAGRAP
jgi:hypothetical protein